MIKKPGGEGDITSLALSPHAVFASSKGGGGSSLGMDLVPMSSDLMLLTCIECVVKKAILVFRL